jgi:hypothetical protein
MINDPELRRMLEEEAKVVRKEHDQIPVDDRDALVRKRKLKNRYEEIERLLGPDQQAVEVTVGGHKTLQRFALGTAVMVVLLGALLVSLHVRVGRFQESLRRHEQNMRGYGESLNRHDQLLREHEQSLRDHEELLREYMTDKNSLGSAHE